MVSTAEKFLELYPPVGKDALIALSNLEIPEDFGDSLQLLMETNYHCSTAEELILERNKTISQIQKKLPKEPISAIRIFLQHFEYSSNSVKLIIRN